MAKFTMILRQYRVSRQVERFFQLPKSDGWENAQRYSPSPTDGPPLRCDDLRQDIPHFLTNGCFGLAVLVYQSPHIITTTTIIIICELKPWLAYYCYSSLHKRAIHKRICFVFYFTLETITNKRIISCTELIQNQFV